MGVDPNRREGEPLPYVPWGDVGEGFFFWLNFWTSRGLRVFDLEIWESCGLSGEGSD
jgi:hypothetical protein